MNLRLRYILAPALVGALAFSCDKKDIEEISPDMSAEASALATSAKLLFEQGFEGSDPLSVFHGLELGAAHSLTVVERPGGGGKTARFELRQNDPDVKGSRRAEMTVVKDNVQKEMWYAFEAFFPAKDYIDEENDEVINQWYQSGLGTPSAALRTVNGRLQLRVGNDADAREKIDLGPVVKDQWQSIVLHMVHSNGSDGLTEVWINGKQVVSRKGGNMYAGDFPKWKMGVYKSRWASEQTTTDRRVLYYDNIRVGTAANTLADMMPSTASVTPPVAQEPATEEPTLEGPSAGTEAPTTGTEGTERIVSYTLVDSETDRDIREIKDGDVLDLSTLGAKTFNIRVNTFPATVGNVQLELSGAGSKVRVDDELPYALFGDRQGDYNNWTFVVGNYTLEGTPHSGTKSNPGPASGATNKINFSVVNGGGSNVDAGERIVSYTLVDSETDRDIREIKDGDVLSLKALGAKKFNVRVNTFPATVGNVQLKLSGAGSKVRVDDELPYALFGDRQGDYNNWTFVVGNYTLEGTPHSGTKSNPGPASGATNKINFKITK